MKKALILTSTAFLLVSVCTFAMNNGKRSHAQAFPQHNENTPYSSNTYTSWQAQPIPFGFNYHGDRASAQHAQTMPLYHAPYAHALFNESSIEKELFESELEVEHTFQQDPLKQLEIDQIARQLQDELENIPQNMADVLLPYAQTVNATAQHFKTTDEKIKEANFHKLFALIKNNEVNSSFFTTLIDENKLTDRGMKSIADCARTTLSVEQIDAMCNELKSHHSSRAQSLIKALQPDNISNKATYQSLLQTNVTEKDVEHLLHDTNITMAQVIGLMKKGSYCKNMWHILAPRYEPESIKDLIYAAHKHLSSHAKEEMFDYLSHNHLERTPKNNQITIALLQSLYKNQAPQGRQPLHKLFYVTQLPIEAFETLPVNEQNKKLLLEQTKEIFSRGTAVHIKNAMAKRMPCNNPMDILSSRSNAQLWHTRVINAAKRLNYDLNQTHTTDK